MENTFVGATPQQAATPANQELMPSLRQYAPEHPALSRMRAKLMQSAGTQVISAYDRMHHRHNRS
jgi:hypothetical protein